jgi:glycosyltransferase involved in cell wall biosynthesis
MTISVVIATYNRAALLDTALAALRRQQFAPGDEVLVVDNASTDETARVVRLASGDFPVPLRYLHEAEPGKTPALNTGLAAARGDILALTDDDVLVADDWIAAIRRAFASPDVALVGGRVDPRWEREAPRWLRVEQHGVYGPMCSPLALLHYGEAQELGARTAIGANMAVRRAVLDAVGGFAPHLGRVRDTLLCGEDHDFCQRVVAAGYRGEYRPEIRVRHWVPAERTRLRYYVRWFFWSGVTNAVLDAGSSSRTRRMVPRYVVRRLLSAPVAALTHSIAGRPASAASEVMEAAFAAGYITRRLKDRRAASRAASVASVAGTDHG